jgi:hypothetical protein
VLSPDVRIADVDGAHWANLLSLFRVPEGARPVRKEGTLLVFVQGKDVKRAIRTGHGPIPAHDVDWRGPATPLTPIRRRLHCSRIVVIDEGALPRLFRDAENLLSPDQDFAAQVLDLLRAVKMRVGAGVWIDPPIVPMIPTFEVVQRGFDRLLPDGRTFVLYVMDDAIGVLWSSLILLKERGDVTLLTTHQAVADDVTLGRAWRRDYRHVLTAVRDRIGPPHIGVFLSIDAARRVIHGPWGSLVREMARRHAVVDPAPAMFLGLLGGAVALGALGLLDRLRGKS